MSAIFNNQDPLGNSVVNPQGYSPSRAYSAGADLTNRLRVSGPQVGFTWKQDTDQGLDKVAITTSNGGSSNYNSAQASTTLSVTTNANSRAMIRGTSPLVYSTGSPVIAGLTATLGTGQANTNRRVGFYDDNDGAYFELAGTTKQVVTRTSTSGSPVNTAVTQANWNVDKLDGTGPSQLTIDWTKLQTFVIDMLWNSGIVRFGVMIEGAIVLCHVASVPNVGTLSGFANSELPPTFEIVNNGASPAGAASIDAMSAQVDFEGPLFATSISFDNPLNFSVNNENATGGRQIGTNFNEPKPLIQIRPKASLSSGQFLRLMNLLIMTTADFTDALRTPPKTGWQVWLNATVTGGVAASWNAVNTASKFEYDIAATGVVTVGTGRLLVSGMIASANTIGVSETYDFGDLQDCLTFLEETDVLTITASRLHHSTNGSFPNDNFTTGLATVSAALNFLEPSA